MQKIETIFLRDKNNMKLVTRQRNTTVQWVFDGEGVATRKWDGTACLIRNGRLYKRLHHKASKRGPAPAGWIHWSFNPMVLSGHGWMPVGDGPEDWMHREVDITGEPDGTYELCGPQVGKNPERFEVYVLLPHGTREYPDAPRTFDALKAWFEQHWDIEGLVWHHPTGEMAKIKGKDFGVARQRPNQDPTGNRRWIGSRRTSETEVEEEDRRLSEEGKAMTKINTANDQMVGAQGNKIVVLMLKTKMGAEEALRHAAWLVTLAESQRDEETPSFNEILTAVKAT